MNKNIGYVYSYILSKLTSHLVKKSFAWFTPLITSKSTDPLFPDPSGSVLGSLEIELYGEKAYLTQSLIIHKMVLISQGYDRIFFLSPNIRLEKPERSSTGRHAYEFTQLDLEMANASYKDVMKLVEDMIIRSLKYIRMDLSDILKELGSDIKAPKRGFKVYTLEEVKREFGENWETYPHENFIWVTNIPRYFYDKEEDSWLNYDLILPDGYGEVLSGGQREYEYNKIVRKMERDGIDKSKYVKLLDLAKKGQLRPSAGGGLGIERFIRWIVRAKSIYDVQPFPRIPGKVDLL